MLEVNGLEALEREARGLSSQLSDLLVAVQVQVALGSTELRTEAEALVKAYPKQLRSAGWGEVELRCSYGHSVKVKARFTVVAVQAGGGNGRRAASRAGWC